MKLEKGKQQIGEQGNKKLAEAQKILSSLTLLECGIMI